ncbi:MAG: TetR/AcrR family transcriptional regulator [Mycobacterium sp.]|nr:TetR/AcrR family transcriptional regulator [Mycobacterium sp.]
MRPLVPTGTNRLSSLSSSTIRIETPRPGRPAALGAFVLLQHGYPASSVAAIARTAGFTTGAFYANFGSKAALTLEVLIDLQAEMQAEVAALVSANFDVDTIEGLREWSTRILDSGWPRLQLEFALAIRDDPTIVETEGNRNRMAVGGLGAIIAERLPLPADGPITADGVAEMVLNVAFGIAVRRIIDPRVTADPLFEALRMLLPTDDTEPDATPDALRSR